MPFSRENRIGTIAGMMLVAIFAVSATYIATIPAIASLRISPLVVGIVLGIIFANTLRDKLPSQMDSGIVFSAKRILRLAIIFYGFRITFQEIAAVGPEGLTVSILMVTTTFLLGTYIGTKILGLDLETAMLTASGSAVCGAAAVLATESVVKPDEGHKSAIAISTVVLFGTIAMFLYPVLYALGFHGLDASSFGIYVGGTVHEVAQVVAVGSALGDQIANNAIIVKMTRVMLIAPMLLLLGIFLSRKACNTSSDGSSSEGSVKLVIPWFALGFIAMAGINSLNALPKSTVDGIINIDTFLLTMAMAALGMETRISKLKNLGLAPMYLALILFAWLLIGGFGITKAVVTFL